MIGAHFFFSGLGIALTSTDIGKEGLANSVLFSLALSVRFFAVFSAEALNCSAFITLASVAADSAFFAASFLIQCLFQRSRPEFF